MIPQTRALGLLTSSPLLTFIGLLCKNEGQDPQLMTQRPTSASCSTPTKSKPSCPQTSAVLG